MLTLARPLINGNITTTGGSMSAMNGDPKSRNSVGVAPQAVTIRSGSDEEGKTICCGDRC